GPEMRVGAVDEELLVAWCRIGDRLRMTSSAEFTGYETTYAEHDLRLIRKLANDLLPDAAEYDKGTYRACNRPMTPDGPPILGQAGPDNLYINSRHGHMGFTMASGSGRAAHGATAPTRPAGAHSAAMILVTITTAALLDP